MVMNEKTKQVVVGAVLGVALAACFNVTIMNVTNKAIDESLKYVSQEHESLQNRYMKVCNEAARLGYGHMAFEDQKVVFVFKGKSNGQ